MPAPGSPGLGGMAKPGEMRERFVCRIARVSDNSGAAM